MKYHINVLRIAYEDLQEIHSTMLEYGGDITEKFKKSFIAFTDNVSGTPYMYPLYERNPKYRKALLVYDYIVFYKVYTKNKTVKIYRVLHGKRNFNNFI